MTKGQALYTAICESVGLDPAKHGVQAKIHRMCDGICTQPQLSTWANGNVDPYPDVLAALEAHFGFRLVQTWTWTEADGK